MERNAPLHFFNADGSVNYARAMAAGHQARSDALFGFLMLVKQSVQARLNGNSRNRNILSMPEINIIAPIRPTDQS